MNKLQRILALFEELTIHPETIQYSVALAQRIDAWITLLMLLSIDREPGRLVDDLAQRGELMLRREVIGIVRFGIEAEFHVRIGDPRSEFYKFMASRPSYDTVIWGGDESALMHSSGRTKGHWIASISKDLCCPLVTPKKRVRMKRQDGDT